MGVGGKNSGWKCCENWAQWGLGVGRGLVAGKVGSRKELRKEGKG